MHTLRWVLDTFPGRFANVVFVSVGEVDKEAFNSVRTLKSLRARIENSVNYFTSYCASRDLAATSYQANGGDPLRARKSVGQGQSVSRLVELGGRRHIQTTNTRKLYMY